MSRPSPENVQRVACVGSGTIGAGWAALFLANGLDMIAHFGWRGAPQTKQAFIDTVDKRWGHVPIEALEDWRDENMLMLLKGLKDAP